jgi:hypothetical protein
MVTRTITAALAGPSQVKRVDPTSGITVQKFAAYKDIPGGPVGLGRPRRDLAIPNQKALTDIRVRRALSMATDREALRSVATGRKGAAAFAPRNASEWNFRSGSRPAWKCAM